MNQRDADATNIDQLKTELSSKNEIRRAIWQNLFNKFAKNSEDDSIEYSICDLPEEAFDEITTNYSNKVLQKDLTQHEQNIVHKIETELESNLYTLILQREKTKIMHDPKEYDIIHAKAKDEIRRLRQFVTREDVETYICLCVTPNKDIKHLIEEVFNSDLKTTLISQTMVDISNMGFWKMKLLVEWNYLTRTIPEEDVIIYAVNVLTGNNLY